MFCRRNGARWMLPRSILAMRRNMKRRLSKSRRYAKALAANSRMTSMRSPSTFLKCRFHYRRAFLSWRGLLGRDTDDPQRAWEIICKEVLAPAHNEKIFTFPGAFLAGLQGKNHKLVEKWLDDALASRTGD